MSASNTSKDDGMSFVWILVLGVVVLLSYPVAQGTNTASAVATVVFIVGGLTLYLAPSIVAHSRDHVNGLPLMAVNLFLGWTLLGWVVCIAWAYSKNEPKVSIEAADTVPQQSVADEIQKLARLRDQGTLSIDEFAAQKAKLLAR